ncbi:hypothetical protein Efla_004352 [Eimeria flavescens]
MGDTASRFTTPTPVNPQKLTPRQLQQLLNHFGLNELSPSKARISLLAFVRVFPGVLQGHAMLLLPTLKEIARQQQMPPNPHGLSFATLSSSSLVADNRMASGIMNGRCRKANKKQVEALKIANSIALQEIIDSTSSCCSGEAPETEMLLMERMLGRIARSFQPPSLLLDENSHIRTALESLGGVSLAPGRAPTLTSCGSGSLSSSDSRRSITFVSLGCSSRACVSLLQILQYGYLEMMYLLNPNSPLFQDPVARTTSGLSCSRAQEVHHKGPAIRGIRATSAWDAAPALKLMFPPELDFTFAVRSMAAALAEAVAPTGANAATPTAAAIAAAAISVTQLQSSSSGIRRGASSNELAAQASGAVLHATSGSVGSGGLRTEVFAVLSWIRATLPALPALCTLGVAAHLLGSAVFDGQPQQERSDSSALDVQYSVYANRRRRGSRVPPEQRSPRAETSSALRGRGTDVAASAGPSRSMPWKRSPSAEAISGETKGWHGDGPLDARSKCFSDEHAFVLRLTSTTFSFPPKAPWTCLYASWKHGTSFSRLCANCFFYGAPMVLVAKTDEGQVLGAIMPGELKEGGQNFFGDANTCLFSLEPQLNLLRTSGLGRNYVYLNTKNKFHPIGIGFGGQVGAFRFWIGDEMKDCYLTRSDCTFSSGRLLQAMNEPIPQGTDSLLLPAELSGPGALGPLGRLETTDGTPQSTASSGNLEESLSSNFLIPVKIKEVEVWGTGDGKTLEQQRVLLKQQEQLRQERRQVDKGRLLDSGFDREFLLGDTFNRAKGPNAPTV